jgi:phosphotriesterase-related protein
MMINGVLGPIDTKDLGETLIHEHAVTCCDWSMRQSLRSQYCEPDIMLDIAVKQLKKAKDMGIGTVVDGTPINLGRDIQSIKKAAELSGMNIIVSTGFYHQEDPWISTRDWQQTYDLLLYECENGVEDTDILPGIFKCAVDYLGFTPYVNNMLATTAKVAAKVGIPIFCHTIPELAQGNQMMDIFDENGVDPKRVVAGHSGDVNDLDYLESVLKRGCYLGMDRCGIETATSGTLLANRVDTIYQLCKRGWTDKLLLSHDFAPYTGFFFSWADWKKLDHLNLEVDFTFVKRKVVPMLLEKGLTEADITQLTVTNARNFFEGK